MDRIPVYILAGGLGRRLGLDKARALVRERPLVAHVASEFRPVARSFTVVARRDGQYDDLGFHTIADQLPGRGPLGGLATALCDLGDAAADDWLLLASCDLVGLRPAWLEELLDARRPGAPAVAFRGEKWQPMPAVYHRSLRPAARAAVDRGRLAVWRLLETSGAVSRPLPPEWHLAAQVNTPAELAALRARPRP